MDRVLFSVADTPITLQTLLFAVAGLFAVLLIALVVLAWRAAVARAAEAENEIGRAHV